MFLFGEVLDSFRRRPVARRLQRDEVLHVLWPTWYPSVAYSTKMTSGKVEEVKVANGVAFVSLMNGGTLDEQ